MSQGNPQQGGPPPPRPPMQPAPHGPHPDMMRPMMMGPYHMMPHFHPMGPMHPMSGPPPVGFFHVHPAMPPPMYRPGMPPHMAMPPPGAGPPPMMLEPGPAVNPFEPRPPEHAYEPSGPPQPPQEQAVAPPAVPAPPPAQAEPATVESDSAPPPARDAGGNEGASRISGDIIDDLSLKFVLSLLDEEREDLLRLMFAVEKAWWYYTDFMRRQDAKLPKVDLTEFSRSLFARCPGLQRHAKSANKVVKKFQVYKATIPVCGAILVSPDLDKVLLVRGISSGSSWMFPRGKKEFNETDEDAAVREVLEETGFSAEGKFDPSDALEILNGEQRVRLFIVPDVSEETAFEPRCRGEIGAYGWMPIAELPANREQAAAPFEDAAGVRHRFYQVWQFIKPLRTWIKRRKAEAKDREKRKGGSKKGGKGAAEGPPVVVAVGGKAEEKKAEEKKVAVVAGEAKKGKKVAAGRDVASARAEGYEGGTEEQGAARSEGKRGKAAKSRTERAAGPGKRGSASGGAGGMSGALAELDRAVEGLRALAKFSFDTGAIMRVLEAHA
ncbi:unnamed protein product [Pedinophyceae sp. YPF-701]|nr:unnamed protein product [Pedinophyceae sp. YPF-701]